jgi:hypothetical protein
LINRAAGKIILDLYNIVLSFSLSRISNDSITLHFPLVILVKIQVKHPSPSTKPVTQKGFKETLERLEDLELKKRLDKLL